MLIPFSLEMLPTARGLNVFPLVSTAIGYPVRQYQARVLPTVQRYHRHESGAPFQLEAPHHGGQEGAQGDPGVWRCQT